MSTTDRQGQAVVEVCQVTKSFGPRTALSNVSFSVAGGEFVALVGPNGAGKTTLLRIIATLSRPTDGYVRIAGMEAHRAGEAVRRHIGFLSHRPILYDDLTAEQNLRFFARMYDLDTPDDPAERIAELLDHVGLRDRRHDLVRTFSRGMLQRLSVARAVLHHPQVLLLDEPYTGLDLDAAQMLTDLLTELAGEGCAILLTTHNPAYGLTAARRILVLSRGRLVYDGQWEDVAQERGEDRTAAFYRLYRSLTGR